jgi:hypothetical protein
MDSIELAVDDAIAASFPASDPIMDDRHRDVASASPAP